MKHLCPTETVTHVMGPLNPWTQWHYINAFFITASSIIITTTTILQDNLH